MAAAKDFTPWDFLKLVKELNEHEAELKNKLAQADGTQKVTQRG